MRLRFIGADGSMGLKHGNVYEVEIKCFRSPKGHIWVAWEFNRFGDVIQACPYSSLAALNANWEDVAHG